MQSVHFYANTGSFSSLMTTMTRCPLRQAELITSHLRIQTNIVLYDLLENTKWVDHITKLGSKLTTSSVLFYSVPLNRKKHYFHIENSSRSYCCIFCDINYRTTLQCTNSENLSELGILKIISHFLFWFKK